MEKENAPHSPVLTGLDRYLADAVDGCELCASPGGELLWEDAFCRVIRVADADYPGFCRVILQRHVAEMTDLTTGEQQHLMGAVFAVERALRTLYRPDKINLASFGNVVPHLHWHVIPRWCDDRHYPQPVWGSAQRLSNAARPTVSSHRLGSEIALHLKSGGKGE